MAVLYVSEYARLAGAASRMALYPLVAEPSDAEQTVAIGGTSAQSSAFANSTTIIRVHTDAICSIKIGTNPTATVTTMRMAAGQTEYFGVEPGHKIAVISNT